MSFINALVAAAKREGVSPGELYGCDKSGKLAREREQFDSIDA